MAKRILGWMPLAAALITSQGLGSGEGVAAHAVDIADEVTVNIARVADGKALQVGVALVLPIKHEVVWDVLNDYENMPRFVPDILATRLISAGAGRKRVEIDGVARLLFLEYPTRTTLDVMYPPMDPLPSTRWQATWLSTVSCGCVATKHTPGSIIRSG